MGNDVIKTDPPSGALVRSGMVVGPRGINFANATEVMEFARMMSMSGSAVPPHLRDQVGACLGILDDSIRFEMSPYALARKSYFVNDRLAYEAQVLAAIVNARAPLSERPPNITYEGEGNERRCTVEGKFYGGAVRSVTSPRLGSINPRKSPLWVSDPDQQLAYYTLRAFARRHCPDVLMGVYDTEEAAVTIDLVPREKMDIGSKLQVAAPTVTSVGETVITQAPIPSSGSAPVITPEPTVITDGNEVRVVVMRDGVLGTAPAPEANQPKKGPGRPKGYSPKKAQEAVPSPTGVMGRPQPQEAPAPLPGHLSLNGLSMVLPLNKRIEAEFEVASKDPGADGFTLTNILDKYRDEIVASDTGMKKQLAALTALYEGRINMAKSLRQSLAEENNANPETGEIEEEAEEAPAEEAPSVDESDDGLNDDQRNVLYELRMALEEVDTLGDINRIVQDFGKAVISNDVKVQAGEIKQARIAAVGGAFATPF